MKRTNKKTQLDSKTKLRSYSGEIWRRLLKNKGAVCGMIILSLLIITAVAAPFIFDYETDIIGLNLPNKLQRPSLAHPFGTDELGRDIMSRIIYGSGFSLTVGLFSVLLALIIGVALGAIGGFYGGVFESIVMRFSDIFLAVPFFLMALIIVSVLGTNIVNLVAAVGVSYVPRFIRVTRAAVLTVKNREYIESARSIGMNKFKIIFKHILPNCFSPIIVQATLSVGNAITTAAALSFLGLGVPVPAPEWGAMLSAGRNFIRGYSYMTVFPGLAIFITVLSLNLLGDGLRDAFDPKLKR